MATPQSKRKATSAEDGNNKRFHGLALLCFICFCLLSCCTPILASPTQPSSSSSSLSTPSSASSSDIVQAHAHANDVSTFRAHVGPLGLGPNGQEASAQGPASVVQTTKAVVQRLAPYFEAEAVVNGDFKTIKLTDYIGKYLVLLFYPLDFTFVCPTELIAFGDRINEFHAIGADVVAVSVDSKFAHLAWTMQSRAQGGLGKIALPLLSDITKNIARDYGVLVTEGPDAGVSLRGLFIISDKGVVRQSTINDLPVGRSVDETIRLVKAFQYTDTHDVVCPAGWTPGSDVMKANPTESLAYFQKQHGN